MKTVLVLGGTGMLGSMIVGYLSKSRAFHITATHRGPGAIPEVPTCSARVVWKMFDAALPDCAETLEKCGVHDWIINSIGITKPLIKDDNPDQIETAIRVNSLLPHLIAATAASWHARVLQIATDCVYSGSSGAYVEADPHDALDVYGKTKSLGECFAKNVHHLRCSIIGPEPKGFKFLFEWFRRQPSGATLNGFRNHHWNGITTLQFARICAGIMETGQQLPHLQHVVPTGVISKAQMLRELATVLGRTDVVINDVLPKTAIDRTLATIQPDVNLRLWLGAGYACPPTIPQMIAEMTQYDYSRNQLCDDATQKVSIHTRN